MIEEVLEAIREGCYDEIVYNIRPLAKSLMDKNIYKNDEDGIKKLMDEECFSLLDLINNSGSYSQTDDYIAADGADIDSYSEDELFKGIIGAIDEYAIPESLVLEYINIDYKTIIAESFIEKSGSNVDVEYVVDAFTQNGLCMYDGYQEYWDVFDSLIESEEEKPHYNLYIIKGFEIHEHPLDDDASAAYDNIEPKNKYNIMRFLFDNNLDVLIEDADHFFVSDGVKFVNHEASAE